MPGLPKLLCCGLGVALLLGCGGGGTGDASLFNLQSIEITNSTTNLVAGDSIELAAVGVYGDGSRRTAVVNWSISSTQIASISSNRLSVSDAGTVEVTATESFRGISAKKTFTVSPSAPTGITIQGFQTGKTDYASSEQRLLVAKAAHPENSARPITSTVTWESSNSAVATVDADGRFRGVSAGNVKITARALGFSASVDLRLVAPAIDPIVLRCGAFPNPINSVSRARWNANFLADPQNGSEWIKFDPGSCTQSIVGLYAQNPGTTDQYSPMLRATRSEGRYQSTIALRSLTNQDRVLAVGNENFIGSPFVSVDANFLASD